MDQIKKLPKKAIFLLVFWGLVFVYFIFTSSIDAKMEVIGKSIAIAICSFGSVIVVIFILNIYYWCMGKLGKIGSIEAEMQPKSGDEA